MKTHQTTPNLDSTHNRQKGSLAGTLVITLLIFTFIPLALMAGAGYLRARSLLREQTIQQARGLLLSHSSALQDEIRHKESHLEYFLTPESDFPILFELAVNTNQKSPQFADLRASTLEELLRIEGGEQNRSFDQYLLLDRNGIIKISSNSNWEGKKVEIAPDADQPTFITHGFGDIYPPSEAILVTAYQYTNERGGVTGILVGITESESLLDMLNPLYDLNSIADVYFLLPDNTAVRKQPEADEFAFGSLDANQSDVLPSALNESKIAEAQSPTVERFALSSGERVIAQALWLPELQAGVVLELKENEIYAKAGSLVPFTIFLFILALVGTVIVIIVGNYRVIKPLRSLAQVTDKFASGAWDERAVVRSGDEVGVLAASFNRMAADLSSMYQALESKVDERSKQIRTAAEVAQSITSLANLDEMLSKTAELVVTEFGYYQASIFMLTPDGRHLEFKKGFGAGSAGMSEKKYRLEVGSESIMGWVAAHNQPRIASDVMQDSLHLKNELLPETRSEAAVPISIGSNIQGVLDVQSTQPSAFTPETVVMLQTLASQIAAAIQTVGLVESTQVNFEELSRLYRSSRLLAEAGSEGELIRIVSQVVSGSPLSSATVVIRNDSLEVEKATKHKKTIELPGLKVVKNEIEAIRAFLKNGLVVTESTIGDNIPPLLREIANSLGGGYAAFLPIRPKGEAEAVVILVSSDQAITDAFIQPYSNLADLASVAMEKIAAVRQTERHLREMESLTSISQAIASSSDLESFFKVLHERVRQIIGDYSFVVALYDEKTNTISIPYGYEAGNILNIEAFPLGEGLTSILIRSGQPLMIVENTEQRMAELGAKIQGKPARSWMGAPMMVQNKPIGAMILQDADREQLFSQDDLKFFTALTGQVAGLINNVRLLDESKKRTLQLQTAAEIARDISGSLNLDELLIKAVNFVRDRFDFYHAAVFLHDLPQEFAVIREATGDAGAQMKRTGYKIGIGSKSIVGYVTSQGEPLVVNDTTKDATYYANPLLPDTRAEAAIPLMVGERILGALDVQSVTPYAFTEDNLRTLQILADQMAIAVVNTELFAETQEHLSQHRLLHHITTTAASGTTLEEALDSAVKGLQVTMGGDRVTIWLTDREKTKLQVKAAMGYADDVSRLEVQIGSGIIGWVAANRRPLRVKNVAEDTRYLVLSANTRSELAVPLIYRNEVLGVLNVESEQLDAYTENDEEMLGTLGGSLAAVIANARLVEQIRQQAERERLVYEVTAKIRRSTDMQSIITTTASELTRITGAAHTKIRIAPDSGNGKGRMP